MSTEKLISDRIVAQNADQIRERIAAALGSEWGAQARIARETGIPKGHLSAILTGTRTLKLRHVERIAKARNVSLAWLVTGEGHPDDVDDRPSPTVSKPHGDQGALSLDQVGKLLAAAERDRLTPDERLLLAKYQSLPPAQRARLWDLLNAGAADPPEPQPEALNEPATGDRGKGRG